MWSSPGSTFHRRPETIDLLTPNFFPINMFSGFFLWQNLDLDRIAIGVGLSARGKSQAHGVPAG